MGIIGIGIGFNYIEGNYSINVCDPYLVSSIQDNNIDFFPASRNGYCLKKRELYTTKINHFSWEFNIPLKLYSYVGDTLEYNFLEFDILVSYPTHYLKHESVLEPTFVYGSVNFLSILVHF